MSKFFLGAHMSIAGGLSKAFERIEAVDGTALQIFSRNQRQWNTGPVAPEEAEDFKKRWKQWGDYPVAVHDSYLVNLASPDAQTREKSIHAFAMELARTEALGIAHLVTHPGSHLGAGPAEGLRRYTEALDEAVKRSETTNVTVLLETTAGMGTNLGSSFEELAEIMFRSQNRDRLGVCFDTCHAFCAGYDIATPEGYEWTWAIFNHLIGLERLLWFHLNDSKHPLASHKDRHEHIGQGELGPDAFRMLMTDPRFAEVPKTIETPKNKDLEEDRVNLGLLRRMAAEMEDGE